jgi:hypothetical protein
MVQLEGDKVMAVAACRGERQLEADGRMHTFAAATSSDGIRIAALLRAGEETVPKPLFPLGQNKDTHAYAHAQKTKR